MRIKKTILFLLPSVLFLSYCSPGKDPINDDDVVGDAKYELTFRGARQEWNPEEAFLSLHAVKTEESGVYSWGLRMQWPETPADHPGDAAFTFYTNRPIRHHGGGFESSLVHPHTFAEEMDCFDHPGGCVNVGYALVLGTEPKDVPGGLAGMDNDIHATNGSITITEIIITKDDGYTIEGHASGHFDISGINTNASKPNPGSASGKFENAPFSTLAIR